jgi:hypothetical protein
MHFSTLNLAVLVTLFAVQVVNVLAKCDLVCDSRNGKSCPYSQDRTFMQRKSLPANTVRFTYNNLQATWGVDVDQNTGVFTLSIVKSPTTGPNTYVQFVYELVNVDGVHLWYKLDGSSCQATLPNKKKIGLAYFYFTDKD